MIKEAIVKIVNKEDLSFDEAYTVMNEIMSGQTTPTQNSAFLAALSTKSTRAETTSEIAGCAAAMRDHATKLVTDMDLFEIVGTGGDNSQSFNISTTSALVAAAGGMNELDAIKLVRRRGILMQSTVPAGEGAMAAVLGLDAKKIEEILESFENVWIANYNCPGQIVITGLTNEVKQASLALKEAGAKRVVELKVSGPFHSLLLKPAGEALLKEMESMSFSPLQVPYIANATAEIVTDSKKISTFFAKGIYSSVRWQQSIETMLENGVDTFVEIGPGKTLAGFMRKIAPKATVYNVSSFEDATALEKCLSKA